MSFRERNAWMCLVSILAVQVPYFAWTTPMFLAGPVPLARLLPAWTLAVLLQGLFTLAAQLLFGRKADSRLHDERDDAIAATATRRAYVTLALATTLPLVTVALLHEPAVAGALPIQLMLAGWVLAELVRYASQCRDYRRSVAGLDERDA